jgi:ADP-heptose:LPS heptosyltransferase
MKILCIRFSSMGDVVIQTALFSHLKGLMPLNHLEITVLTSREFSPLLVNHPAIAKVFSYDRRAGQSLWTFLKIELSHEKYDLIIDLHDNLRSHLVRWFFWATPNLVINKRRWERDFLVRLPFKKKFFQKFLRGLEPQSQRTLLDWSLLWKKTTSSTLNEITQTTLLPPHFLLSTQQPVIAFALGASFSTKKWPLSHWGDLLRLTLESQLLKHFAIVILAGPSDKDVFELEHDPLMMGPSYDKSRLHFRLGKATLEESKAWLVKATMVVGVDSGMNHIAEAYGKPVLTLMGPTHEAFGFAPFGKFSKALSVDLWCRPCSTTGSRPCFREKPFCMELITPQSVLEEMHSVIHRLSGDL